MSEMGGLGGVVCINDGGWPFFCVTSLLFRALDSRCLESFSGICVCCFPAPIASAAGYILKAIFGLQIEGSACTLVESKSNLDWTLAVLSLP